VVITVRLILLVVCLCVWCIVAKRTNESSCFGVWVYKEDSYFALDDGSDLTVERETSPCRWDVEDTDNFLQCHRFDTHSRNSHESRAGASLGRATVGYSQLAERRIKNNFYPSHKVMGNCYSNMECLITLSRQQQLIIAKTAMAVFHTVNLEFQKGGHPSFSQFEC